MNSIENLFEWLLAASLRASVLVVAILGIQFVLRHRLPAAWRHALWLPMLAVLVLPVLPEAPFALFPRKSAKSAPVVAEMPAETVAPLVLAAPIESPASAMPVTPAPVMIVPASTANVNLLAILWLSGACGVLLAGLIGYHRNLRKIWMTAAAPNRILQAGVAEAAREAGLSRSPRTFVSPAVASPAVTGFVRPLLLLPAGFPAGFSAAEARLILLHEFSHLKRLDLPLNWLMCILQAMHWFNPLLWFAFARMRADRETACDARVLSIDVADRRAEYGGALLKLQCVTPSRALSLGFVGIFERSSEIKARIREISAHRPGRVASRFTGGSILTLLMVFGVTKGQQPDNNTGRDNAQGEIQPAPTAEAAPTLEGLREQIRVQEDKVEERRRVLTAISQSNHIIHHGEKDTHKFEQEIMQLESQIQSLLKYDSEARMIYASSLDLPDNIIRSLYPQYLEMKREIEGLKAKGLGDRHPSIVVKDRMLEAMKGQLDKGVLHLRTRLKVQLDMAKERLAIVENADPAAEARKAAIQRKLDSIIIPQINFDDGTPLDDAVDFLRLRVAELDGEENDPDKKGVNFVIIKPRHAGVAADVKTGALRLRNAPLGTALKYICEQAGFQYKVDDTAVILSPKKEAGADPALPENR